MLKIIGSFDMSRLEVENRDGEVIRFDIGDGGVKIAKKLGKSKGQNLFKF